MLNVWNAYLVLSASERCYINKHAFFLTFVFPVSLAKVDGGTVTKCNFAGDEKAGASWTDKIMANKAEAVGAQKPGGEGEGAEEDEWVRTPAKSDPSLYTGAK